MKLLQDRASCLNKNSALYTSLLSKIKFLQKLSIELSSYQDSSYINYSVEYGARNDHNFGIEFLTQENRYTSSKVPGYSSNTQEASIFYKAKLLQQDNFVLSTKAQISMIRDAGSRENISYELSLLSGSTKSLYSASLFTQNTITVGTYVNDRASRRAYYHFSTSEGIKFDNGIMLVNYIRYSVRQDFNSVYNKTLFKQFSVAKLMKFDNVKYNNLTMQIGYFLDQSLTKVQYRISGMMFSLWLDV